METKIEDGCACQLNKHREGRFLRAVPLQIEPTDGYQQSLQESMDIAELVTIVSATLWRSLVLS